MNILITGGASGLGRSITEQMAADAANKVFFTYNRSNENAAEITRLHPNCIAIKSDMTSKSELDELIRKIGSLEIDLLVNNAYAGNFIDNYFHKTELVDFFDSFHNNTFPILSITQVVLTQMRKKKSGAIINVLTAALKGTPPIGTSVYLSVKAYLEQMTRIWAAENAKFNIRVNAVSPSFMMTALTKNMDERLIEQMKDSHPDKKILTTEEAADTICKIATEMPDLNGYNIFIDGTNLKKSLFS